MDANDFIDAVYYAIRVLEVKDRMHSGFSYPDQSQFPAQIDQYTSGIQILIDRGLK